MTQTKLDRINELARKSRTPEGLTEAEKAEQKALREEYIAGFRVSLKSQLENIRVLEPDGRVTELKQKETDVKA